MASRARCGSRFCQRLGDPFGETVWLDRQHGGPVGNSLQRRLPDPVQREDDADDPGRVVDQPLEQRQPLAGAKECQET